MQQKPDKQQLLDLEKQLSCPDGQTGIEVAKNMNISNAAMTASTIQFLGLSPGSTLLELGHGNCGHLGKILDISPDIRYFGLEISKTMFQEAQSINHQAVSAGKAVFQLYEGSSIPFDDNFFDRIMSVNTIYFWAEPEFLLTEIKRTLTPGGCCVITFAEKDFMKTLPFVGKHFTLYGKNDMKELARSVGLDLSEFSDKTDRVKSKTGDLVQRRFTMAKLSKNG